VRQFGTANPCENDQRVPELVNQKLLCFEMLKELFALQLGNRNLKQTKENYEDDIYGGGKI
jgi:hypothetical protein